MMKMLLEFQYLTQSPGTTFVIIIIQDYLTTVCPLENVAIDSNSIIRGIEEPQVVHKRTGND
jgi:hypothetical protein